ncbi:hypothetical protein PoB_000788800 [Plakobranchus ocellatus]|uniref:Uncharacterized protein n=1 Tax=Plakobranchus ocellatus TaxID=259542 RepID=A0AAV3YGW3_9GAST|nr:hypothetical protein PoB_000788800 [Plakobranchus ocellatus]
MNKEKTKVVKTINLQLSGLPGYVRYRFQIHEHAPHLGAKTETFVWTPRVGAIQNRTHRQNHRNHEKALRKAGAGLAARHPVTGATFHCRLPNFTSL